MPLDRSARRMTGGREDRGMKFLQIALSGAVAAFVACGCGSAARAGDDDVQQNKTFGEKFMDAIGLHNPFGTEYDINYGERSPLVVPPTRDLPPPQSASTKPVPNWPVDPEITARAKAGSDDKPTPRPYDSVMHEGRPLTPAELGVGAPVSAPGTSEASTPSQLGEQKSSLLNFDWLKKEDYGTFTGEPPRASLTDPPPGYQTPSPNMPYGILPANKVYKPPTLGERMEPVQ
jgi:hypothetical protein